MVVKSLTKKNCKEIGAEYVGKVVSGHGIEYSYKGVAFLQEASRSYGTLIYLLKKSFASETVYKMFLQNFHGKTDSGYQDEFELSDIKAWMDSIVDAIESAEKQVQAPITEEELQNVTTEIRKQKQAAWHKLEEAKTFVWWENMDQTCMVIQQMRKVKKSFQEIDKHKDTLSEDVSNTKKRESLLVIYKTLERVQEEVSKLVRITNIE